jgi:hypothetical protein
MVGRARSISECKLSKYTGFRLHLLWMQFHCFKRSTLQMHHRIIINYFPAHFASTSFVTPCLHIAVYILGNFKYFCTLFYQTSTAYSLLFACLAYLSTRKIEAVRSSETSVHFYHTTLSHVPEDNSFHSHNHKILKSNWRSTIDQRLRHFISWRVLSSGT